MSEISRLALFGKLNPLLFKSLEGATVFCKLRGNPYVELVHWLHQLLQENDSDLLRIFRHFEIDAEQLAVDVLKTGGDFVHGFTYSGHPVAAAVGLENLRILKEEGIVERVKAETAPYLQRRLRELADHPLVGEVRGVGMLGAIELVQDKASRKRYPSEAGVGMICRGHCFKNGLIMRAVGDRMIIAPPLVMTRAQIDEMMALIRRCLDATLDDLRAAGQLA